MYRNSIITILFALQAFYADARLTIGVNAEMGYPFYKNRKGFHDAFAPGTGLYIAFRPVNARVFPSLSAGISVFQMPVYTEEFSDLTTDATNKTVMLHLNFKSNEDNEKVEMYWFGGIGIDNLRPDTHLMRGGNSIGVRLYDDGSTYLYPAVDLGLKYMRRVSERYSIYIGAEAFIKYIWLYKNGNYFVDIGTKQLNAEIDGHIIYPAALFSINYMFQQRAY